MPTDHRSPSGSHLAAALIAALAFATLAPWLPVSAQVDAPVSAREPAGTVVKVSGKVTATDRRGAVRDLVEEAPVFVDDRVETGSARASYVTIRFRDDTRFALGRSSTMEISDFVYGRSEDDDRIATRVLKGAFRFVSGLIARARPRSMGVVLPTATIGIRGTTVGGEVDGERVTVVLLEPEEPSPRPTAIEVSNEHGSVTIDEEGFGTEVADASSPPSAPRRMRLRTIENLMRSMQSLTRITAPRPRPRPF